jgi:hypothetical protein
VGRFGLIDGLVLLALQLGAVALALWLAGRRAGPSPQWRRLQSPGRARDLSGGTSFGRSGGGPPPLPGLDAFLWPGLASYFAAFAAHIAAFALLRHFWPLLYADHDGRRPWVALAWALATGLTLLLWRSGAYGKAAALFAALLAAGAYYAFVALRG